MQELDLEGWGWICSGYSRIACCVYNTICDDTWMSESVRVREFVYVFVLETTS